MFFRTIFLCCAILAGALSAGAAVTPEKLEIVTGAEPTATEQFAASELSRYIGLMTGTAPAVVPEPSGAGVPIHIGRAAGKQLTEKFNHGIAHIEHDAFVIEVLPNRINVTGNSDRGTLYGVYELLEQQGCRWFFPGKLGECVPRRISLSFPEGKQEFIPDFNQRTIDIGATDGIDFGEMIDWAAKNRLNFLPAARMFFVRKYLPPDRQDVWKSAAASRSGNSTCTISTRWCRPKSISPNTRNITRCTKAGAIRSARLRVPVTAAAISAPPIPR